MHQACDSVSLDDEETELRQCVYVKSLQSCSTLCDPWTVFPLGFSRQEYWNGLPYPPPGDLPNPGVEPGSSTLQADSLPSEPPENPYIYLTFIKQIGSGKLRSVLCDAIEG